MKNPYDVIKHNFEEFMENGPRLHTGLQSTTVARTEDKVLKFGLGGIGVGQMWFSITDEDRNDPDFEKIPLVDSEGWYWDVMGGRGLLQYKRIE